MWNAETGQTVATLKKRLPSRKSCSASQFQFSSNSKLLGWLDDKGTVWIWSIRPCNLLKSYRWRGAEFLTLRRKGREKLSLIFKYLENEITMSKEAEYSPDECLSHNDVTHTPRITIQDDWVVLGEQRSILLAPEYRPRYPRCWDAQSNVLAVGPESGSRPYFIRFNPHNMSAGQLQHDDAEKDSDAGYSSDSSLCYINEEYESDGLSSDSESSADGQ